MDDYRPEGRASYSFCADRTSSLCSIVHSCRRVNGPRNDSPRGVREYSTPSGEVSSTRRRIMPLRSSLRSVWVSTRCVTPSSCRLISLNRVGRSRTAIAIIDHLSEIWSRMGRLGQSTLKRGVPGGGRGEVLVSIVILGSRKVRY